MSLSVENLFKARDFVELKNISGNRIELTFKNPVIAMLARGKVQEIANQCSPDSAFHSCELTGSDLILKYNPELVNERLLSEVFVGSATRAKDAAKELADYIAERQNLKA